MDKTVKYEDDICAISYICDVINGNKSYHKLVNYLSTIK